MRQTIQNERTTPFVQESRDLANACLDRFQAITHRTLTNETPRADQEAYCLIKTGFPAAIREAQLSGREMLAFHLEELLREAPRDGAYIWLNGLAIDGRGCEPPSASRDARASRMQSIGEIVAQIEARRTSFQ